MKRILLPALMACLLFSCEKIMLEKSLESNDPTANLDYLWQQCNEKYAYFEVKDIDWDQVYAEYAPKVFAGMSQDSLFQVMADMVNELRDDHANLFSPFDISLFGTERLGQDNFDWRLVKDIYLPQDFYISGPFLHDYVNGTNREIAYVLFPSFTGTVGSSNLDFILDRYQDTRGLILDLRENGGGVVTDIYGLLGRFVEQQTLLYYTRTKNGPAHDDFTSPEPVYLNPYAGQRYLGKVAVLVDRGTYSAGSFTALASKALPNLVLLGDTTGGGLGVPNGGQLPNGWTYRFSITQTLDLNQDPQYENGVPPDIRVLVDWTDLSKDEVIERALLELQ